ncbi:MAG: hypothetical protein WH035_06615, partial [Spirochaetota bacterium]
SGSDLDFLFKNIFFRDYTFDPDNTPQGKLLKPDEIIELESDLPIIWKDEDILFAHDLLNSSIELQDFTINLIKLKYKNNLRIINFVLIKLLKLKI